MGLPLPPEDERNRRCIQLYHHVAALGDLRGKDVLEVSCGHGGGAAYLARTFIPKAYTGLDLNRSGIEFCRRRHAERGLRFLQGDASNLPFESAKFDAVINVEASHCYPSFERFLSEVSRVLRPGGELLYADFRFSDGFEKWDAALAGCPLEILAEGRIHAEVLKGMDLNSERSLGLVQRLLPLPLQSLGRDFAGVQGSRIHRSLASGEISYRSYRLVKPVRGEP